MPIPASELITRLQMETDRAPDNSPEWRRRMLYFLSKAQERVVRDAPFLTREQEVRVILDPDTFSASATDLFETTDDAFVIKRVLPEGSAAAAVWDLSYAERHGGKIIRVSSPSDQGASTEYTRSREFVVREVWTVNEPNLPDSPYFLYVSLNRPWEGGVVADMEYRMFTKDVVLPPEMGQVISVKIHDHPYGPLDALPQTDYDEWNYARYALDNVALGVPRLYARGQTTFLQSPHVAPTVVLGQGTTWTGPEPKGKFTYAISLVFGKQEVWLHAGNPSTQTILDPSVSRVRPWNESTLGPASDLITGIGQAEAMVLTFPSYDFAEGFDGAGTLREGRSGYKVRIWRSRHATASALDYDSRLYLLDEVTGDVGTYTDNGSVTPDRNTPAPAYSGTQQTLQFFPSGDFRYEMKVRGACVLAPLRSETQVPNLDAMAVDLLIHLAKAYMYEASANTAYALSAFRDYTGALEGVMKRTSSAVPPNTILSIGYGGSTGGLRRRYPQYPEEPTEIS